MLCRLCLVPLASFFLLLPTSKSSSPFCKLLGMYLTTHLRSEIFVLMLLLRQLVGELISAILGLGALGGLVGSLLSTVLGLVGDVTNVISDLGLTELTGVLGL